MGKKKGTKTVTMAWTTFTAEAAPAPAAATTNWADDEVSFPPISAARQPEARQQTQERPSASASKQAPDSRETAYRRTDRDTSYGKHDDRETSYRRPDRDTSYGKHDDRETSFRRPDRESSYGRHEDRETNYRRNDRDTSYGRREEGYSNFGRRREDYDDRREQPREKREIPTSPPFNAYIGNLPYGITETDVENFLKEQGLQSISIRLIRERDSERLKGFGYVEFETVEDLKKALSLNDVLFNERSLKVDIASGKQEIRGRSDLEDNWRSAARSQDELPSRDSRENNNRRGGFSGRSDRGDRNDRSFGDRGGDRGDRSFGDRGGDRGERSFGGRGFGRDFNRDEQPAAPRAERGPRSDPFGNAKPREENIRTESKH